MIELNPVYEGRIIQVHLPARIGRAEDNDLCILDEDASRYHARIERSGEVVVVTDLGSTNGTYLNGNPVASAPLSNNDILTFGNSLYRVNLLKALATDEVRFSHDRSDNSSPERFCKQGDESNGATNQNKSSEPAFGAVLLLLCILVVGGVGGFVMLLDPNTSSSVVSSKSTSTSTNISQSSNGSALRHQQSTSNASEQRQAQLRSALADRDLQRRLRNLSTQVSEINRYLSSAANATRQTESAFRQASGNLVLRTLIPADIGSHLTQMNYALTEQEQQLSRLSRQLRSFQQVSDRFQNNRASAQEVADSASSLVQAFDVYLRQSNSIRRTVDRPLSALRSTHNIVNRLGLSSGVVNTIMTQVERADQGLNQLTETVRSDRNRVNDIRRLAQEAARG